MRIEREKLPRSYFVNKEKYHFMLSRNHKPVLEINPGDRVTLEINEVTSSQLTQKSTNSDVAKLDASKFYPLSGPVRVIGARKGDALVVDILKVATADWGWSAIIPGLGLLEEFNEPYLWTWRLGKKSWVNFKNGLRVRYRPFCGFMGVAPDSDEPGEVMPPGFHGGNMDVRHLTAGSRLLLPIQVEGGLFSAGDVHAAQGDGEVCVAAIECAGAVTVRVGLIKDAKLEAPHYFTAPGGTIGRSYVTTGVAPDLMEACKQAVRRMIGELTTNARLSREEAYIFCSVAADLRVHEIVDKPNYVVGLMIDQNSFGRVWKKLVNRITQDW
jgi:acetamidase/formamidase